MIVVLLLRVISNIETIWILLQSYLIWRMIDLIWLIDLYGLTTYFIFFMDRCIGYGMWVGNKNISIIRFCNSFIEIYHQSFGLTILASALFLFFYQTLRLLPACLPHCVQRGLESIIFTSILSSLAKNQTVNLSFSHFLQRPLHTLIYYFCKTTMHQLWWLFLVNRWVPCIG